MSFTTSHSSVNGQDKDTITVDVKEGTDFNSNKTNGQNTSAKLSDFNKYRITESTPIDEPVPIVTINGETLATEGNIVTISGASKSGKSAFAGWLLAGAISITGIISDPL